MEARTPHWRAVVLPVAFALACAILTIATWVAFGGSIPFEPQGYRFYMPLPQATNVYEDTSVRIAGVTVGKVISVSRSGRAGAKALVQIDSQYAPVRAGATAIVRAKTLLGEGYIEMAPGPRTASAVPDGGSLAATQVRPTQQLFDVLRIFTPGTRAQVRSMFAGLAAATDGRSEAISDSLADAAPTATNLTTIADTLNGQSTALARLIADSGTVLSALGAREGVIQSAVRSGNAVFGVTAERNAGLAATVAALPAFLSELRSASGTLGATSSEIGAGVGALEQATPELVPALQAIDAATPTFRQLFERLPAALSAGERELPALDRILAAARPALAVLYPTVRQLIPVLQLLSADRTSVVGSLANAAQINNGVLMAPQIGPVHFSAGAVTIWNETIAGWVHKLPTNRSDPYPAPSAEGDIATGGLRAYDCRNTGNPLVIPPTGTGAPPCKVQGPWTFDGKSAYYPRLQEAGP
jgi:phospholipid/cholesterol/gamma-HCH transport system substrate-binding protein